MQHCHFTTKIIEKLDTTDLEEFLPDQLHLIADYDIDLNDISTIASQENQKYFEKLFLALLHLISLLDEIYINAIQDPLITHIN